MKNYIYIYMYVYNDLSISNVDVPLYVVGLSCILVPAWETRLRRCQALAADAASVTKAAKKAREVR